MAKESKLAMMPMWPGDYIADTRLMSLAERGAYSDFLFYAWLRGGLPADVHRQSRMLGVSVEELCALWPAFRSHFHLDPKTGLLVNDRLERERVTAIAMRTKAHERAQLGGDATKAKWETDPEGMTERAKTKARVAAHRAKRKATSQAASTATSPADAMPQAMLEEGSPALSLSKSQSESESGKRVSEGEPGKETRTHGLNGRGKT
jgi:uncharacterized protein YdaU (DUF1376 family)